MNEPVQKTAVVGEEQNARRIDVEASDWRDAIAKSGIMVVKFDEGIEWASMDNVPVTCAIAILTPAAEAGTTHLQLLSKVAVQLMDEGFRTGVQEADSAEKVAELVNAGISEA